MSTSSLSPLTLTGVVFDGDDTLWRTEVLYDQARAFAREIVEAETGQGRDWEALERRIDVANVAIFGYGALRFPTSCVQAYEQLCAARNITVEAETSARIERAARTVFQCDPPIVPGARETLMRLRSLGVRLALLTKGDFEVQMHRIAASTLSSCFDAIDVVAEKDAAAIKAIVAKLGVALDRAWMVGNSVRSDVLPALAAGIRAIWIDAYVWEHERSHDHLVDARVVTLPAISDVVDAILGVSNAHSR